MSEDEPWSRMTPDEIEGKIAAELGQHPFGGHCHVAIGLAVSDLQP